MQATTPGFIQSTPPNNEDIIHWVPGVGVSVHLMSGTAPAELTTIITDVAGDQVAVMSNGLNILQIPGTGGMRIEFFFGERDKQLYGMKRGSYTLTWTWLGGSKKLMLVIE